MLFLKILSAFYVINPGPGVLVILIDPYSELPKFPQKENFPVQFLFFPYFIYILPDVTNVFQQAESEILAITKNIHTTILVKLFQTHHFLFFAIFFS